MSNDSEETGGIGGKELALVAAVLVGLVLVVRALRGGDDESDDGMIGAGGETAGDTTDPTAADTAATDALPVDADMESAMDELDIVDAIYILVAGLKAAREEYRQRTDDGGA
jgi:hypothetical protein